MSDKTGCPRNRHEPYITVLGIARHLKVQCDLVERAITRAGLKPATVEAERKLYHKEHALERVKRQLGREQSRSQHSRGRYSRPRSTDQMLDGLTRSQFKRHERAFDRREEERENDRRIVKGVNHSLKQMGWDTKWRPGKGEKSDAE